MGAGGDSVCAACRAGAVPRWRDIADWRGPPHWVREDRFGERGNLAPLAKASDHSVAFAILHPDRDDSRPPPPAAPVAVAEWRRRYGPEGRGVARAWARDAHAIAYAALTGAEA
jgi:hypothetical protein